jgi:seryl-tRNA synthetase
MLALNLIRNEPDRVRAGLAAKGEPPDALDAVLEHDEQRRAVLGELEELRRQVNEISRQIGPAPDQETRQQLIARSKEASAGIGPLEKQLATAETALNELLLAIPNLPHESVPPGKDEHDNVEIRRVGNIPEFDFDPLGHVEIAEALGLFDTERAAKLSGSGFWLHRGLGAKLQRVLINWMLDLHTSRHGYTEVYPPALIRSDAMTGTGQLPKFANDSYHIESDDLWLAPTAEVPVTNIHRNEILPLGSLPINYAAYTPCFRREAGAAGTETRGLLRVHQFDKVELVKFVEPATSYDEQLKLLANAEAVLQELELPYRVIELCAGDLSGAAAKCFDIELWAAGTPGPSDTGPGRWLEISSVSNFEDYQARRAGIRYRPEKGARPRFAHTLNGSGVALPRLIVALLENNQQPAGSVAIPKVLHAPLGTDRLQIPT